MDAPTNPDIHGLHLGAAHKALSSARAAAAVGYWRTCSIETRRALLELNAAYACQPMHEDPPPPVLETAGAVGLMESDE